MFGLYTTFVGGNGRHRGPTDTGLRSMRGDLGPSRSVGSRCSGRASYPQRSPGYSSMVSPNATIDGHPRRGAARRRPTEPGRRPWTWSASDGRGGRVDLLLVCSTGGHLQPRRAAPGVGRLLPPLGDLRQERRALGAAWGTGRDRSRADQPEHPEPPPQPPPGCARPAPVPPKGHRHDRRRGRRAVRLDRKAHGEQGDLRRELHGIEEVSLSGRLIAPIADRIYVQWPELRAKLPRARHVGSVFFD